MTDDAHLLRDNIVIEKRSPITMYGRPNCPAVRPVQKVLEAAGAEFDYIDIHQDEAGRRRVLLINEGNESVPTLVFPDGSTLTEPGPGKLRGKLRNLGYDVSPTVAWFKYITGSLLYTTVALLLLYFLLRAAGIF